MYNRCSCAVIIYMLIGLFWIGESNAYLLMVSQERKLQISSDRGAHWAPYFIHRTQPYLDFFDLYYHKENKTLYILALDRIKNKIILFSSTGGTKPFLSEDVYYITLDHGTSIEFMKIREAAGQLHVFGRINGQSTYYSINGQSTYYKSINHRAKRNFHFFRKIYAPLSAPFLWKSAPKYHPFFNGASYTILDIFHSQSTHNIYISLIEDPHASGTYPFIHSRNGRYRLLRTPSTLFNITLGDHSARGLFHDKYEMDLMFYPTMVQNPSGHASVFWGNENGIYAQNTHTPGDITQNDQYDAFASMLFTEDQHLFFVSRKESSVHSKAMLAYGSDISNLTNVQPIDETLQDTLSDQIVLEAIQNGFYCFVQEENRHLFFLSYFYYTKNIHVSLVLESHNRGQSWNVILTDRALPSTVRGIINIPHQFTLTTAR